MDHLFDRDPAATEDDLRKARFRVSLLVSLCWLAPALLAILNAWIQSRLDDRGPLSLAQALWQGGDWLLYAVFTPFIFALSRRYPLRRDHLAQRLTIHVLAALFFCAAWAGSGMLLRWWLLLQPGTHPSSAAVLSWISTTLPFGVAVYFAVLGVEHAVTYFLEARARETQAARLAAQLSEARLAALRMQLHPHFLFNSLNAVMVLVRDGANESALRVLEQLGELLHEVLRTDNEREVHVAQEIEFLRRYLAIEQVRFSDRLRPVFEVNPDVLGAAVPTLVLQPLVENALRHGIAQNIEAGALQITARREGDDLVLTVSDDGPGPDKQALTTSGGVGLKNTRERLHTLYGERARLELVRGPNGGALATIRLPYHELLPPIGGTGG
jgi:two-component system LytT family sensor kinase